MISKWISLMTIIHDILPVFFYTVAMVVPYVILLISKKDKLKIKMSRMSVL